MAKWWVLLVGGAMACGPTPQAQIDDRREMHWDGALPPSASIATPRGLVARRAVFHLHSPWSHDACDDKGLVDGEVNATCRDDLRAGLCRTRFDLAYLTDHPDFGDAQPFEALFHAGIADTWLTDNTLSIACEGGHEVRWHVGFEDRLMPVDLSRHIDPDPATRHDLLNRDDAAALNAMTGAGGVVLMAHTESRSQQELERLQDAGLHGVEAFNLHAMFGPDIRQEYLGLDPLGWLTDLGPFLAGDSTLEPDLLFLAVHGAQPPSLARWDALLQRGPMMGTAGTDAHQNVLPGAIGDGERVDSYRRMLRWMSTMLLARGTSPAEEREALEARRAYVAFEALGTPVGVDLHVEAAGETFEMGSNAPAGEVVVACPEVHGASPWVGEAPEIVVRVLKDGEAWQTGCGRWPLTRGVVRVEVDMTPRHLLPFLGEEAERWMRPYPWVYTGAIRVGME